MSINSILWSGLPAGKLIRGREEVGRPAFTCHCVPCRLEAAQASCRMAAAGRLPLQHLLYRHFLCCMQNLVSIFGDDILVETILSISELMFCKVIVVRYFRDGTSNIRYSTSFAVHLLSIVMTPFLLVQVFVFFSILLYRRLYSWYGNTTTTFYRTCGQYIFSSIFIHFLFDYRQFNLEGVHLSTQAGTLLPYHACSDIILRRRTLVVMLPVETLW